MVLTTPCFTFLFLAAREMGYPFEDAQIALLLQVTKRREKDLLVGIR